VANPCLHGKWLLKWDGGDTLLMLSILSSKCTHYIFKCLLIISLQIASAVSVDRLVFLSSFYMSF